MKRKRRRLNGKITLEWIQVQYNELYCTFARAAAQCNTRMFVITGSNDTIIKWENYITSITREGEQGREVYIKTQAVITFTIV